MGWPDLIPVELPSGPLVSTPNRKIARRRLQLRASRLMTAAFLAPALALAQDPAQKGIELSDMNRNVEACSDFFEFSNGAWRAMNPIPPSQVRWSRRWQSGETAKERLKGLLDEAVAVKNPPKGSVDQLIADFYGACMNETEIERLGVSPLDPLRAQIRAMKTPAEMTVITAITTANSLPTATRLRVSHQRGGDPGRPSTWRATRLVPFPRFEAQ
jgi:hypothetical protein